MKRYLASLGIYARGQGCGCDELAREMDAAGADEVRMNIDYFADAMCESSKKWIAHKTGISVRPPRAILKRLILWACEQSDEEKTDDH